jgi:hypothetical protein
MFSSVSTIRASNALPGYRIHLLNGDGKPDRTFVDKEQGIVLLPDDTLRTVKIKLLHALSALHIATAYEEIYLYGYVEETASFLDVLHEIHPNVTRGQSFEYSVVAQLLETHPDSQRLLAKLPAGGEPLDHDLLHDLLQGEQLGVSVKTPLGMAFADGKRDPSFAADPFFVRKYRSYLAEHPRLVSSDNLLLLSAGSLVDNAIYVCLANSVMAQFALERPDDDRGRQPAIEEYVLRYYFPALYLDRGLRSFADWQAQSFDLVKRSTNELLTKERWHHYEALQTLFAVGATVGSHNDLVPEIQFLSQGVQHIRLRIKNQFTQSVDLASLFAVLHAHPEVPCLKYQPPSEDQPVEATYRVYAPSASSSSVATAAAAAAANPDINPLEMVEEIRNGHQLSALLRGAVDRDPNGVLGRAYFHLNPDGSTEIEVYFVDLLKESQVHTVLAACVVPSIRQFLQPLRSIGYQCTMYTHLRDRHTVEIIDLNYVLFVEFPAGSTAPVDADTWREAAPCCAHHLFSPQSPGNASSRTVTWRRVGQFEPMTPAEELVVRLYTTGTAIGQLTLRDICHALVANGFVSAEDNDRRRERTLYQKARALVAQTLRKHQVLGRNSSGGFPLYIRPVQSENEDDDNDATSHSDRRSAEPPVIVEYRLENLTSVVELPPLSSWMAALIYLGFAKLNRSLKSPEPLAELRKALTRSCEKSRHFREPAKILGMEPRPAAAGELLREDEDTLNWIMDAVDPVTELEEFENESDVFDEEDEDEDEDEDVEYEADNEEAASPTKDLVTEGEEDNRLPLLERSERDLKAMVDGELPAAVLLLEQLFANAAPSSSQREAIDMNVAVARLPAVSVDMGIAEASNHHGVREYRHWEAHPPVNPSNLPVLFESRGPYADIQYAGYSMSNQPMSFVPNRATSSPPELQDRSSSHDSAQPLPPHRWGLLPASVDEFLGTSSHGEDDGGHGDMILVPEAVVQQRWMRYGVEQAKNQSFLGCFAEIFAHRQTPPLTNVPTVSEFRELLARRISLDTFSKLHHGTLLKAFLPKANATSPELFTKWKTKYGHTEFAAGLDFRKTEHRQTFEHGVQAFEQFLQFLRDPQSQVTHEYLWDLVCGDHEDVVPGGLNLVVLERRDVGTTDRVELVCPSALSSSYGTFNWKKDTVVLLKQGGWWYEPLYLVEIRSGDAHLQQNTSVELANLPRFTRFLRPPQLSRSILHVLQQIDRAYQKQCPAQTDPVPSLYRFQSEVEAKTLVQALAAADAFIEAQVLNHQGQLVGFLASRFGAPRPAANSGAGGDPANDDASLFLPCAPAARVTSVPVVYVDDRSRLERPYATTYEGLRRWSRTLGLPLRPAFRVQNGGEIVGFLLETQQFVPVVATDDAHMDDTLPMFPGTHASDVLPHRRPGFLAGEAYGADAVMQRVRGAELEGQFFRAFRHRVRKLLHLPANRHLHVQAENIGQSERLGDGEKRRQLASLLTQLIERWVVFVDIEPAVLAHLTEEIACDAQPDESPVCVLKENNIMQLVLPKRHLVSGEDNERGYVQRLAEELAHNTHVQEFMYREPLLLDGWGTTGSHVEAADDEIVVTESELVRGAIKH